MAIALGIGGSAYIQLYFYRFSSFATPIVSAILLIIYIISSILCKNIDIAPTCAPTNLDLFARIWHPSVDTRYTVAWVCLVGKMAIIEGSNPPRCAILLIFSEQIQ